jgi:hypothetical protein
MRRLRSRRFWDNRELCRARIIAAFKVLSAVKSVPDTTRPRIAKIDEKEVFSDLRRESVLILAMFLFPIASVSTALDVLWQHAKACRLF